MGVEPEQVEVGVQRELHIGASSAGVASASRMASGLVRPSGQSLAVDLSCQRLHCTSWNLGAQGHPSLVSPPIR